VITPHAQRSNPSDRSRHLVYFSTFGRHVQCLRGRLSRENIAKLVEYSRRSISTSATGISSEIFTCMFENYLDLPLAAWRRTS
jgi:hypothetical protein